MVTQLFGVARCDLRTRFRVEKNAVIANREDAGQLVRDHDDRGAQAVAELKD